METFFSTFWNGLINTYTKEKLVIIITCRAPCVHSCHLKINKKFFHESLYYCVITLTCGAWWHHSPTAPWSPHCPMSAVSGPGPRLSPARAPSPDSQHPDTGARIRQDPEFWRIFPTKNGPRATNTLRLTTEGRGPIRGQMLTQVANEMKDENAPLMYI